MQLQSKFPYSDGDSCKLLIEDSEDLWHLFNLITPNDQIRAPTTRKVKQEDAVGNVKVKVKRIVITIDVVKIDFSPKDASMRVSGKCLTDCEEIRLGQFHTLELTVNDTIHLTKPEWDFLSKGRIKEATDPRLSSEVAAVLIEGGEAALYLIANSLLKECGRVHGTVSKNSAANQRFNKLDKQRQKFFDAIMVAIQNQFDLSKLKCVVVGGSAEMTGKFIEYMFTVAAQKSLNQLLTARKIFVECEASGIGKTQLAEALGNDSISKRIAGTKAMSELQALKKFYSTQTENEKRVSYGPAEVIRASELGAIDTLLISDTLIRADDIQQRRKFGRLVQSVTHLGGTVHIVSSVGCCSTQLKALAEIAVILRYPIDDIS